MPYPYFLVSAFLLAGSTGRVRRRPVFHVKSLSGKLALTVQTGAAPRWLVQHEDMSVVTPCPLSLRLAGGELLGKNAVVASTKTVAVNTASAAPVYKKREIADEYNQFTLK